MMKKEKNGVKATLLSLVMAAVLMLPMSLLAQKSDGFFRSNNNDDVYNDRDSEINYGLNLGGSQNENPTEEVPLGGGLLVLAAAGAGYALARRNKAVRKGVALLLACALMLGMTQCKKNTMTPTATDDGFHITLKASYGGEKTGFVPGTGFIWSDGETENIIVKSSTQGYLGYISGTGDGTSNSIEFSGTLDKAPAMGSTLYFCYVGNNTTNVERLDFSEQDGTLSNIRNYHIANSDGIEYNGQTDFSAELKMKMAVAYFNTSSFDGETVYIHGNHIFSEVTISNSTGALTTVGKINNSYIKIGNAGEGVYVALIPSTESETTIKFESNRKTGSEITFLRGIRGGYYYSNSGEALTITAPTSVTADVIPGLFTISGGNIGGKKMVRFSKGNLQFTRESTSVDWSTGAWSFTDNQYDVVETSSVSNNYASQTAVGLFGWGTSGWDNGNKCYVPYSTSNSTTGDYTSSKGYGYGPHDNTYNVSLNGDYSNADWGVYNSSSITNGGGYSNWHTLSATEFAYLLNTRSASTVNSISNARYARIVVNGRNGLVLFPDSYIHPKGIDEPKAVSINTPTTYLISSNWTNYTAEQFVQMQNNGAVFLPGAGQRNGTSVSYLNSCYYNTTTSNSASNSIGLICSTSAVNVSGTYNKYYGMSVRLVRE